MESNAIQARAFQENQNNPAAINNAPPADDNSDSLSVPDVLPWSLGPETQVHTGDVVARGDAVAEKESQLEMFSSPFRFNVQKNLIVFVALVHMLHVLQT